MYGNMSGAITSYLTDPAVENPDESPVPYLVKAIKTFDTGNWDWDRIDCCITTKNADIEDGKVGIEISDRSDEDMVRAIIHTLVSFSYEECDSDDDCGWITEAAMTLGSSGDGDYDGIFVGDQIAIEQPWIENERGEMDCDLTVQALIDAVEAKMEKWHADVMETREHVALAD